ncbi:phosphatidate phosphatase PAH1-like isoform X1 [Macadamia integrifolia]|uniref:phosphatidate phosphatase PAH1-like isoform X1 n=1 Tax=Macadamia integrifolia TaxID=60698 RepID=UPI001C4EA4B3|nr:phosphatidate phosphatase PAH1-like isoform X1 [Macadamia integrifolia]
MNVVGKVGSLISQGVYSVATPFHPFGGAVDVIVVEQQDGTYRSTPWYVRFGKFQGVLKGSEKIVRISVNGVEAGFHMYLDNSGEAYFVREVLPSKDQKIDGLHKNPDNPEVPQLDSNGSCNSIGNIGKDSSNDNHVSLGRDENAVSNSEEFFISNECLSLNRDQLENVEADNGRRLYTFQDDKSPGADSVGSSEFGAYHYESLDHVENVVESQGSDSEVVLVSVDGHVLTAPISSLEQNTDNVQLSTPQFHLGPGEGTDYNGDNEEFCTGEDAWAAADYLSDINVAAPNSASDGTLPICNADRIPSEVCEIVNKVISQSQDAQTIESIERRDHGHSTDIVVCRSKKEFTGNCLQIGDADAQNIGSPFIDVATKQGTEDPLGDSYSSLPPKKQTQATDDPVFNSGLGLSLSSSGSAGNSMSVGLSIDVEYLENSNLIVGRSDNEDSDITSVHSVSNDPGWKDEQFGVAPEALGLQDSPGGPSPEEECSPNEIAEIQKGASGGGMGFEISLSAANSASEGVLPICNADQIPSEVCEIADKIITQTQDAQTIESIKRDHDHSKDIVVCISKKEITGSCSDLSDLCIGDADADAQNFGSPFMDVAKKQGTEDPLGDSYSSLPPKEQTEATDDPVFNAGIGFPLSSSGSAGYSMSAGLSIDVEDLENNNLIVGRSDNEDSDSTSVHSVSNDPGWKDEQFGVAPEDLGLQSSLGGPSPEEECSPNEIGEIQKGASGGGMGFEISLCANLLYAGMGMGPAGVIFDAHCISEEEFKASAASITKNENLIVRFKGKYLTWDQAAPVILGMAAFGLDLPVEPKDAIPMEQDESLKPKEDASATSSPSSRRWRLWPIPFRRVKTLQHTTSNSSNEEVFVDSEPGSQNPPLEPAPVSTGGNESPHKQLVRTNVPTTEQIASLNLKEGQNMVTFSFSTRVLGTQKVDAHIYLWKWNARIVISDVDGTITKSDVLGQFMPLVGKDWTQSGVTRLFSAIKENGYQLLFLSARAIVQAYLTRSFLLNIKQDGKTLPNGPVVISPDGLFPSLYREVIRRAPHEFKIACLEDIKALFPKDYNPFYAGFGNRDTDELSYRKIGIPKGKIFIINPKGEVAINHSIDVKSYTSLHTLVNDMFPPTSLVEQEDFNAWNYWKIPLPNID